MPAKKKASRRRRDWTPAETKLLRQLAGKKSFSQITKALKRSAAAVRFKAHTLRISLAMR